MIWCIIAYIICGYIGALLYYTKINYIDGKQIENKGKKAFLMFLFWPIITISAIAYIPFMQHDKRIKERKKNESNNS